MHQPTLDYTLFYIHLSTPLYHTFSLDITDYSKSLLNHIQGSAESLVHSSDDCLAQILRTFCGLLYFFAVCMKLWMLLLRAFLYGDSLMLYYLYYPLLSYGCYWKSAKLRINFAKGIVTISFYIFTEYIETIEIKD